MFKRTKKVARNSVRFVKNEGSKTLNVDEIKENYHSIKDLAHDVIDPRKIKQGRIETFESAKQRLNLSEKDIEGSYQNFFWRFYIFLMFLSLVIGIIVSGVIKGSYNAVPIALGGSIIFIAQMVVASFRTFQIRHRELFSLKTWASNPSEWIPPPYEAPKSSKSKSLTKKK